MADKHNYEKLLKKINDLEGVLETYRALVDRSPDFFFRIDLEGRVKYASPSVYNISGYTVEESIGMKLGEEICVFPDDLDTFMNELREKGDVSNFEAQLKRKDGSTWWASTNAHLYKDEDGSIVGVEGISRDISDLKNLETARKAFEERFRVAFHTSPDSINLTRVSDGTIIDVNQGFTDLTGYTREDVIGKTSLELNLWKNPGNRKRFIDELMQKGYVKDLEIQFVKPNGEIYVGLMSARIVRIEDEDVVLSVTKDITDRKSAEEALKRSEEVNRLIVEQVGAIIWTVDKNLRFISTRGAGLAKVGLKPDQLIGQSLPSFLRTNDEKNPIISAVRKGLLGHSVSYRNYFDGIDWESHVEPLRDNDDNIIGCIVVSLDITERKKAEEALKKSEEKYKDLFEEAPVGYTVFDSNGCITEMNRRELEMIGYSAEEIIGKPVWDLVIDKENGKETVMAKLAGDMPPSTDLERIHKRKDGTTFLGLIKDSILKDNDGRIIGIRSTIQDITERKLADEENKKLEKKLVQAQKLEAIGRLAGGVAHDLNNQLTPILLYSEMLLSETARNDPRKEKLEQIIKACEGGRDLVRQLLAFGRKQKLEYRALDLNEIITGFEKLLRRTIREDIEINIVQSPLVRPIMADIGQIEQVIMNLAVNAADSMPEGGKLSIETSAVNLDEEYAKNRTGVKPGDYVSLVFSDTGCGMSEETRSQIFEPFFSTKGEQGTGLGLATVYGIVKQHNGNIWVYSELGKGTTFKVYLPMVENIRLEKDIIQKSPINITGSETILLVEDDENVRDAVTRVLKDNGYRVLAAENGFEALKVIALPDVSVDLLLTDVIMPKMNGKELYDRLVQDYPKLKVIYMSGYTDNLIAYQEVLDVDAQFIQKPFTNNYIILKIREVINGEEINDIVPEKIKDKKTPFN